MAGRQRKRMQTGQYGEELAAAYLIEHGYTILERGWHCQRGEIDIIAAHGDTLVFVEVKTRHSSLSDGFAAITAAKRERLIAAAYTYLDENEQSEARWRIDAIAVAITASATKIEHVEDALDW